MKEVLGVHHMKLHVFDDDVMITGSNLSDDYFTTWQDRCYVIWGAKHLANWAADLNSVVADASFQIDESNNLTMMHKVPDP